VSRPVLYVLSFIVAVSMAGPAAAGEARLAQSDLIDGLYLESTGHAVHIKAPAVEGLGFALVAPGNNLGQDLDDEGRADDVGGGWDGRLGFKLPGGPKGLSIEFGGPTPRPAPRATVQSTSGGTASTSSRR